MASSDSNSGVPPSGDGGTLELSSILQRPSSLYFAGQEKQKMLLSSEQGHFSLVKSVPPTFAPSLSTQPNAQQGPASCRPGY
jgi:hypothetical protein